MRAIRSILCWVYGFEAVICLWPVADGVWAAFRRRAGGLDLRPNWLLVVAGIAFAMTCWAYWRRMKTVRWWGGAAGVLNLVFAGAMIVAAVFLPGDRRSTFRMESSLWGLAAVEAAVGFAGIVAFSWYDAAERAELPGPARIEGDGTHPLFDKLVWLAGFGGFVVAMWSWWRWARVEGLPQRGGLPYYMEFLIAELAMVTVHELGHALTGKALGMRVRAFIVGPFQWRVRDGRWGFQFRLADLLATGGAAAVVPARADQTRSRELWMIAGGPLASLIAGAAAVGALLAAPHHRWRNEWELLALFATLSLLAAVVNLLPFQTRKEQYSDGAQLYQLLSQGAWGDYHHAMGIVGATTVTALRPRDYDIGAMERAAEVITQGPRALHLRLLMSAHYRDCGRMKEAGQALNDAADVYEDSASGIPAELHTAFVIGKAMVQRDADGAREWWERMKAKKANHLNADYWLARAALLSIEGHKGEAREAWAKGNALAQKLPNAGAYEVDREKFAMLGRDLDAQPEAAAAKWHEELVTV